MFELDITKPLSEQCVTVSPVHLLLQSTSPYNSSTQDVALSDTTFTIPAFGDLTPTSCKLAAGTVTARFSGSVGNVLTLDLHGALTVPPPATTTTTTLSATPPGPVLAGTTTVTVSATITGTGATSPTTGPTGTMRFLNGTTLLATQPVTSATTIYKVPASALLGGSNELTAVYSGGNGFKGSTSSTLTYVVTPTPSVVLSGVPSSVTGGTATLHTFTVTLTNPSSGEAWTHLFLQLSLSGIRNLTSNTVTLQYEDSASTWCSLVGYRGDGGIVGNIVGVGSTCTPTYPASFPLATSHSLTIHFRIAYPTAGYYGVQQVTAVLNTGTCTSLTTTTTIITRCTAVSPLEGTIAPKATAAITVVPASPLASTIAYDAARPATATVHKTFDVNIQSTVGPMTLGEPGYPVPTGTVNYKIDGITVATEGFVGTASGRARTGRTLYSTATLSVGKHTLVSTYSGDHFYAPSTLTGTFTVIAAPTGTLFACTRGGLGGGVTLPAYVTATATMPSATPLATTTASVSVTGVSVTIVVDPATIESYSNSRTTQSPATIGFSPTGSPATAGFTTFTNLTGLTPSTVGTWTDVSTMIPVKNGTAPGTPIAVGVNSILYKFFHFDTAYAVSLTCVPAAVSAPVGSVPVAGTTLAVSPATSAPANTPANTPVTLTATVYPTPKGSSPASHVTFFDGTTNLGAATVSNTGSTAGTASLIVTPAVGTHVFKATWSGTTTVPANTSNSVSLTVNPAPPTPPAPPAPPTPPAPPATSSGYHLVASNGSVYSYGTAPFYGSMGGKTLNKPIVGTATTPGDGGYWLVASDGGIFAFGDAQFYGSMGGQPLNQPIVGIASTPDGKGYWEVASDGGIFAFGDAAFYGSMGGKPLNKPIVGVASTPDGKGYWMVASDGGIFAFGDAAFAGSTGSLTLNKPIVGMASTNNGQGYWLVAADGGVFAFGNAGFHGTVAGTTTTQIVSLVPTADGGGYWETASNGQVFQFGDATSAGTALAQTATIVAMAD